MMTRVVISGNKGRCHIIVALCHMVDRLVSIGYLVFIGSIDADVLSAYLQRF